MWIPRETINKLWKYNSDNSRDTLKITFVKDEEYNKIAILKVYIWDCHNNKPVRQIEPHEKEIKLAEEFLREKYEDFIIEANLE